MALDTNAMSKDTLFINQGAKPTQRDENTRIGTVVEAENTNIAHTTENSENKRIGTV
jgi:hypothetical protein